MPDAPGKDRPSRADSEIARRFAELRRSDDLAAPSYDGVRRRTARPDPGWSPRVPSLTAAAAAAMLLLLIAFGAVTVLTRGGRTGGSGGPDPGSPAEAAVTLAEWQSPTDFLLETPGSELLSEVPASPQPPPDWAGGAMEDARPRPSRSPERITPSTPAQKGAIS